MRKNWIRGAAVLLTCLSLHVRGEPVQRVVDVPTRAGVSERLLIITPASPRAAVILFAGGDGGVRIQPEGRLERLGGNFLLRSRMLFAAQDLVTVVIDAPSDRLDPPFLLGFRDTAAHAEDLRAVIAWLRQQTHLPVWLIGTSRGTQSAAAVAVRLAGQGGPDGIVLTSSILRDKKETAVPEMALENLTIPVLVVHHEQDGCKLCPFDQAPGLLARLTHSPRKQLIAASGGADEGNPCEAQAHHGYNGIEAQVVRQIADWILAP